MLTRHVASAAICLGSTLSGQADRITAQDATVARIAVVNGCIRDGAVDHGRLGLGAGGRAAETRTPSMTYDGVMTAGGIRIQVRDVGVKLSFAPGAELLVTPDGRVQLRDGSRTLPSPAAGLRLRLTDGTAIEMLPSGRAEQPFDFVGVRGGGLDPQVLWERRHASRRARLGADFRGRELHVLGDGRSLYTVTPLGPVLVCQRVIGPAEPDAASPDRAVILVGDLLAVSLAGLHDHAQRRAPGDPQLQKSCTALARMAGRLFPPGTTAARPAAAIGEPVIPLAEGMYLRLDVRGGGPLAIELHGPDRDPPIVEWTVTNTTHLHVVTEDPTRENAIRYAMPGLDLRRMVEAVHGADRPSSTAVSRARETIRELRPRTASPSRR